MPGPSQEFLKYMLLKNQLRPMGLGPWARPFYDNIMQEPISEFGMSDNRSVLSTDPVDNPFRTMGQYNLDEDKMMLNVPLTEEHKQRPGIGDTLRHEFLHRGAELLTDQMEPIMQDLWGINPFARDERSAYYGNRFGNEAVARMSDVMYAESPRTREEAIRWLVRKGQGDFAGQYRTMQQLAGRALGGHLEGWPDHKSEEDNPWWKFW